MVHHRAWLEERNMLPPWTRRPDDVITFEIPGSHGRTYFVRRLPGGAWTCQCPDFTYRNKPCKHIQRARARLAETVEVVGGLL